MSCWNLSRKVHRINSTPRFSVERGPKTRVLVKSQPQSGIQLISLAAVERLDIFCNRSRITRYLDAIHFSRSRLPHVARFVSTILFPAPNSSAVYARLLWFLFVEVFFSDFVSFTISTGSLYLFSGFAVYIRALFWRFSLRCFFSTCWFCWQRSLFVRRKKKNGNICFCFHSRAMGNCRPKYLEEKINITLAFVVAGETIVGGNQHA